MSWLRRLLGGSSDHEVKPQRLDYLSEALTLERQGDYDAALTSYKLALRDQPNDHRVLQNMAIAYSKTGRHEEAGAMLSAGARPPAAARRAHIMVSPFSCSSGATRAARARTWSSSSPHHPKSAEADRWVRHARQALDQLRAGGEARRPGQPARPSR